MKKLLNILLVVIVLTSCRKVVEERPLPIVNRTNNLDTIFVYDSAYLKKGDAYITDFSFYKSNRTDTARVVGVTTIYGKFTTTNGTVNNYIATPTPSFVVPTVGIQRYVHYFNLTVFPNNGDVVSYTIDSVRNTANRYHFIW